jgi:uncharacterized membrane-anchored protein
MKPIHLPTLGPRYWTALCLASIFGANMGDFFAHDLGLGHVAGLPFLAAALLAVLLAERFESLRHEVYYWTAIIVVRTAATNFADYAAGDLKLPRIWVMAVLTVLLIAAVWASWHFAWRRETDKSDAVLRADLGYWVCMFLAGTLGTEAGDYSSHNLKLGDAGAALLLSPMVALMLVAGRAAPALAGLLDDGRHDPGRRHGGGRLPGRPPHARIAAQHPSHGPRAHRRARRLEGPGGARSGPHIAASLDDGAQMIEVVQ